MSDPPPGIPDEVDAPAAASAAAGGVPAGPRGFNLTPAPAQVPASRSPDPSPIQAATPSSAGAASNPRSPDSSAAAAAPPPPLPLVPAVAPAVAVPTGPIGAVEIQDANLDPKYLLVSLSYTFGDDIRLAVPPGDIAQNIQLTVQSTISGLKGFGDRPEYRPVPGFTIGSNVPALPIFEVEHPFAYFYERSGVAAMSNEMLTKLFFAPRIGTPGTIRVDLPYKSGPNVTYPSNATFSFNSDTPIGYVSPDDDHRLALRLLTAASGFLTAGSTRINYPTNTEMIAVLKVAAPSAAAPGGAAAAAATGAAVLPGGAAAAAATVAAVLPGGAATGQGAAATAAATGAAVLPGGAATGQGGAAAAATTGAAVVPGGAATALNVNPPPTDMAASVEQADRLMTDAYLLSAQLKETAEHVRDDTTPDGKEQQAIHVINLAAAIGDHIVAVEEILRRAQEIQGADQSEANGEAVADIETGLAAIQVLKQDADRRADAAAELAAAASTGQTPRSKDEIMGSTVTAQTKNDARRNRQLDVDAQVAARAAATEAANAARADRLARRNAAAAERERAAAAATRNGLIALAPVVQSAEGRAAADAAAARAAQQERDRAGMAANVADTRSAAEAAAAAREAEAAAAARAAQEERDRAAMAANVDAANRAAEAAAAARAADAARLAAGAGAPTTNVAAALAAASGQPAEATALLDEIDRMKSSRIARPPTVPQVESTFAELNRAYEVLRRILEERRGPAPAVPVGSIPPLDPDLIAGIERARMVLEEYKKEEADNAELLRISTNLDTLGHYDNQELRNQDTGILNEILARRPDSRPWINPLLQRLNLPPPVIGLGAAGSAAGVGQVPEVGDAQVNLGQPGNAAPAVANIQSSSAAAAPTPGLAPVDTAHLTSSTVDPDALARAAALGLAAAAANASATAAAHTKGVAQPALSEAPAGTGVGAQSSGADGENPQTMSAAQAAAPAASPAAANTTYIAPNTKDGCEYKTTIENPTLQKVKEHVQKYIDDTFQFEDSTMFKVPEDQLKGIIEVIKKKTSIDIVNPIRVGKAKTFNTFGPTCVGSHVLFITFNKNKQFEEATIPALQGGAKPYNFAFLITVPGHPLKQYTPGSIKAASGGKKNGTLKRNRGGSNHVRRLYTRTKRS